MNDEAAVRGLIESQVRQPEYLRTTNGLYFAWSLATPPHQYGDWSLVSCRQSLVCNQVVEQVEFVEALSDNDIEYIEQHVGYWYGLKLDRFPWALVCGTLCSSQKQNTVTYRYRAQARGANPFLRTGV